MSLLQRLLEKYKSIGDITKRNTPSWNINYRSHADLLELPSKLFYNSELRACGRVPYHLKAPYPYVFICSSFTNDIPVDAQCAVEADRLIQAVQLHSDKFKSWEPKDTCIMTPSLKQVIHSYIVIMLVIFCCDDDDVLCDMIHDDDVLPYGRQFF